MSLLIDGYNLLFAAGLLPRGAGPRTLERARHALLVLLAERLNADELYATVVVFDAKQSPPDRGPEDEFRGIRVLYARDHDEADDLIEELIRLDSTPRRLVVVTSDLRLRTAAKRRRARAVKSEDWLDRLEGRRGDSSTIDPLPASPRRAIGLDDDDVTMWLDEFGLEAGDDQFGVATEVEERSSTVNIEPSDAPAGPAAEAQDESKTRRTSKEQGDDTELSGDGDWGPFPPGYGDDVLGQDGDHP